MDVAGSDEAKRAIAFSARQYARMLSDAMTEVFRDKAKETVQRYNDEIRSIEDRFEEQRRTLQESIQERFQSLQDKEHMPKLTELETRFRVELTYEERRVTGLRNEYEARIKRLIAQGDNSAAIQQQKQLKSEEKRDCAARTTAVKKKFAKLRATLQQEQDRELTILNELLEKRTMELEQKRAQAEERATKDVHVNFRVLVQGFVRNSTESKVIDRKERKDLGDDLGDIVREVLEEAKLNTKFPELCVPRPPRRAPPSPTKREASVV
jgi:hypothetical protein